MSSFFQKEGTQDSTYLNNKSLYGRPPLREPFSYITLV